MIQYVTRVILEWGLPWWIVDHVNVVCDISEKCINKKKIVSSGRCHFIFQVLLDCVTHDHWVTCKIDLKEWILYIYDSIAHLTLDEP